VAGWASPRLRVERDGSVTTLASHFEGKRINSPNDIVVRSDGSIYLHRFPRRALQRRMAAEGPAAVPRLPGRVRISPDGAKLDAVVTDTVYPNGLAFATDESCST